MSTRGLKRPPPKGIVREARRRKMVLDVDLNVAPPGENRIHEESIAHSVDIDTRSSQSSERRGLHDVPIDVEAIDDDVMISSPTRFIEARNIRNREVTVVLDVDWEAHQGNSDESITRLSLSNHSRRGRVLPNDTIVSCDINDINLDINHSTKWGQWNDVKKSRSSPDGQQQAVPQPKEVNFTCAICMNMMVEATSTVCGHIFCKECIKNAIAVQKKCPTCRRKLTNSNIHRIYLPNAQFST